MSTRARQTLSASQHDAGLEESTTHISPETVSRLKAECIDEPSALRHIIGDPNDNFGMVCELAAGTTATVYLAVDRRPDAGQKFVAVKRFLPELTRDKLFAEQFVQDMRLASSLDHPFVCKVRDFGRAGTGFYTAMDFLLGQSLDEALFSAGLRKVEARTPRLLARIAANLAEGLHAWHVAAAEDGAADVIHGDVTPRNLYVLFDGGVRVTDFGMTWARDTLRQRVAEGDSLDHSYLAPEQLERGTLDVRVDVWALGVVLWELLAGQKLFRCPTAREAAVQITARRIPPPSEFNPQVNGELDRIVLKALTRNRDKRYASMLDLSNDLERYLDETGSAVRATDIASWLSELFPAGKDRDQGLIELAEEVTASRALDFEQFAAAAPVSGAYLPADQDETENTTHIFAGRIEQTMRSQGLNLAPPVETVSLRDAPITVRRPRKNARRSRWRAAVVPFAATFGVGLLGLAAAQSMLPRQSAPRVQPIATTLAAKVAEPTAAPPVVAAPPAAVRTAPAAGAALSAGAASPRAASERSASESAPARDAAKPSVVKSLGSAPATTPASEAPSSAAAAGPTGQVFLTTPGGGDVFEKGRFLGRAPNGFELSPGWHTLVIKSGSDNRTATVQVKPNSSVMVSVPVTPAAAPTPVAPSAPAP